MNKYWELSGSTLKWIALVTMLIDHIGVVLVESLLLQQGDALKMDNPLYVFYYALRLIGRIAFPIYCFLLVEGFVHTRNVARYAVRLGAFAFVSEIPFDLAFFGRLVDMESQNVFFTLFLGLLAMLGFRTIEEKLAAWGSVKLFGYLLIILAAGGTAQLFHTDYGAAGVLCILVLYCTRKDRKRQLLLGCFAFLWELTAPLAFLPIAFYNGKRGRSRKYFFYAFYPIHLLGLYFLAVCLGLKT